MDWNVKSMKKIQIFTLAFLASLFAGMSLVSANDVTTSAANAHIQQTTTPPIQKSNTFQSTTNYQSDVNPSNAGNTPITDSTTDTYHGKIPTFKPSQITYDFIEKWSKTVHEISQQKHVYASVMMAQAILESDSGQSLLSQKPHYNLFGIKSHAKTALVNMNTSETINGKNINVTASFASYHSFLESFEDYANLLNTPLYKDALKDNAASYKEATDTLAGKYATDKYYSDKLNQIIENYHLSDLDNASLYSATSKDNAITDSAKSKEMGKIVDAALSLSKKNIPYVWGGETLSGFDCSGLVKYIYQQELGVSLPHYTVSQEDCVHIKDVQSAVPGDLLFWGNPGQSHHVAIYVGNNQYVAAPQPGQNVDLETISSDFNPSFAGSVILK